MKTKGRILTSLILLSSGFTMNAQTLSFPWGEYIGTNASYKPIIKTNWQSGIGDYVGFYTSGNDANNSNEKMRLILNGNFGIGRTNPLEKLDVNGSIIFNFGESIGTNALYRPIIRSNWESGVGDYVGFYTSGNDVRNASEKMRLTYYGNLLIGKTSQINIIYKLDVAGSIRANEIVVNTTGADFVFDNSYKLPSLIEVEEYIKLNNHLPDIKSAAAMQMEGVGVSELQTQLLQKIEEMTLYIIEQNKRIIELEKQNVKIKTLEEKIEKLEAASK
jgi:hypothetical protein